MEPHLPSAFRGPVPAVAGAGLLVAALALVAAWDVLSAGVVNACIIVVTGGAGALALLGVRHRTEGRVAALLLAGGLVLNAGGDLTYAWLAARGPVGDASPADAPYLLAVVALIAALLLATFRDAQTDEADAIVDSLTVVIVSVLLLWQLHLRTASADGAVGVDLAA